MSDTTTPDYAGLFAELTTVALLGSAQAGLSSKNEALLRQLSIPAEDIDARQLLSAAFLLGAMQQGGRQGVVPAVREASSLPGARFRYAFGRVLESALADLLPLVLDKLRRRQWLIPPEHLPTVYAYWMGSPEQMHSAIDLLGPAGKALLKVHPLGRQWLLPTEASHWPHMDADRQLSALRYYRLADPLQSYALSYDDLPIRQLVRCVKLWQYGASAQDLPQLTDWLAHSRKPVRAAAAQRLIDLKADVVLAPLRTWLSTHQGKRRYTAPQSPCTTAQAWGLHPTTTPEDAYELIWMLLWQLPPAEEGAAYLLKLPQHQQSPACAAWVGAVVRHQSSAAAREALHSDQWLALWTEGQVAQLTETLSESDFKALWTPRRIKQVDLERHPALAALAYSGTQPWPDGLLAQLMRYWERQMASARSYINWALMEQLLLAAATRASRSAWRPWLSWLRSAPFPDSRVPTRIAVIIKWRFRLEDIAQAE